MRELNSGHGASDLRELAALQVREVLTEAEAVLDRVQPALYDVDAQNREFEELYRRFEVASANFPFEIYSEYYTHDLTPPTEPLFTGLVDRQSDKYGPVNADLVDEIRARYALPVAEAVDGNFSDAKRVFYDVAAKATVLRRLSGFEEVLERLGEAIKQPWRAVGDDAYQHYGRRFPTWVVSAKFRLPPHREIAFVRDVNQRTLRMITEKLYQVVGILRAALAEIPFSDVRKTPSPTRQV